MRRFELILSSLFSVLGTIMLLAVIITALPLTVPRLLGYQVYNIVSGSMEPAIPMGSVIYVASAIPEEVEEGEVIAFWSGESVIAHRVVENRFVVGDFVTRGDANAREDMNAVPYSDLIGVVAYHIPFIGKALAMYASRFGKLYVLLVAVYGVIFNLLSRVIRARRREKLEKGKQ